MTSCEAPATPSGDHKPKVGSRCLTLHLFSLSSLYWTVRNGEWQGRQSRPSPETINKSTLSTPPSLTTNSCLLHPLNPHPVAWAERGLSWKAETQNSGLLLGGGGIIEKDYLLIGVLPFKYMIWCRSGRIWAEQKIPATSCAEPLVSSPPRHPSNESRFLWMVWSIWGWTALICMSCPSVLLDCWSIGLSSHYPGD